MYADPPPDDDELADIYDEHYFAQFGFVPSEGSRDGAPGAGAARGLEATKRATFARMLRLGESAAGGRPNPPGRAPRLLDVGCGLGFSLLAAADAGYQAIGLDPLAPGDPDAYAGRRILRGTLEDAPPAGPFDVITLVDVIEHVRSPAETLRRAREMLADDGFLVVATNDSSSPGARLLGPRWTHFHRAHLWFFTPATLRTFAARAGLEVLAVPSARRVYNLDYVASILARGDNFPLARGGAKLALRLVPGALRAVPWPAVPEGFVLVARPDRSARR